MQSKGKGNNARADKKVAQRKHRRTQAGRDEGRTENQGEVRITKLCVECVPSVDHYGAAL